MTTTPAGARDVPVPTPADFDRWLTPLAADRPLAVFLDYDGTLTPLVDHPSKAVLAPDVRALIAACAVRADTWVAIVSGRALADVQAMVQLPGLTYAGNHGLEIAGPDVAAFRHADLIRYQAETGRLARALDTAGAPGTWTETKGPTLTFHFRALDPGAHARVAARARAIIEGAGFVARDAHCAVEARPPIDWHKGRAVVHLLEARYGPRWPDVAGAVYVGDDQTDEDAFRLLAGTGATFRVAPTTAVATVATHRLPDVAAVASLLAWLAHRPPTPGAV